LLTKNLGLDKSAVVNI